MNVWGRFRRFLVLFGFLALFITGYTATSVVTSCTAQAQCCGPSLCIAPVNGLSSVLSEIFTMVTLPGLGFAVISLSTYYAASLAVFSARVMYTAGKVVSNWLGWWDTFWYYNFNPALQDMARQLAVINADQARAIGAFTDMMDRNRLIRKTRRQAAESHQRQSPGENVCVAGTVMGGMVRGGNFSRAYEAAATQESMQRSVASAGTPAAAGRALDMQARYRRYVERYCDANENLGAAGCADTAPFAGLDRDVGGLLFQKDTIDLRDPDVKQATDDLIANIAEPFVIDPQPENTFTSAAGRGRFLDRQSYRAKRQVIYDALYHVVARRAPGTGMGDYIAPMRQEAGVDPAMVSSNPSQHEVMEVMTSERYRSPQYAVRLVDEPESVAREKVVQAGLAVQQTSNFLDMMDRYSLIVAARAGDRIRKNAPVDAAYGAAGK